MSRIVIHPSITVERVEDACRRQACTTENPGFCLACGAEQDGCEPDASEYECENCGANAVYSAEEVVMQFSYQLMHEVPTAQASVASKEQATGSSTGDTTITTPQSVVTAQCAVCEAQIPANVKADIATVVEALYMQFNDFEMPPEIQEASTRVNDFLRNVCSI